MEYPENQNNENREAIFVCRKTLGVLQQITKTQKWLDIQLSQTSLTEYDIPNPIHGIGDGELLRKVRRERRQECHMAENTGNKPEKKFRAGGIVATIWKNVIKDGDREFEVRSVNLERSYKDKDGEWKNTTSMRSADLPRAILVMQKAYEFCASTDE